MKRFFAEFRLYLCNYLISNIPSHTIRLWFYSNIMKFEIGYSSTIFLGCSFDCSSNLKIGKHSVINSKCRLDNRGKLIIGSNVSISQEVTILTADHEVNSVFFSGRTRQVVIEDYVWIGTRALILPGIIIGRGAVIAAGAIVTKNVDPFSVVAGVPAKKIAQRTCNLQYNLKYKRLFQ